MENNTATFNFNIVANGENAAIAILDGLSYVSSYDIEEVQPFSTDEEIYSGTLNIVGKDDNDFLEKISQHVKSEHFEPYYGIIYKDQGYEENYSASVFPIELAKALGKCL